jgi:site-specific DNA-cytosine methylase
MWIIDVDASMEWATWQRGVCPCLTRARGPNGFWITHKDHEGMMTIEEVMALQGYDHKRIEWKKCGISKTAIGQAMGDAMSLNVMSRVFKNARIAAGLSKF